MGGGRKGGDNVKGDCVMGGGNNGNHGTSVNISFRAEMQNLCRLVLIQGYDRHMLPAIKEYGRTRVFKYVCILLLIGKGQSAHKTILE